MISFFLMLTWKAEDNLQPHQSAGGEAVLVGLKRLTFKTSLAPKSLSKHVRFACTHHEALKAGKTEGTVPPVMAKNY